MKLDRLLPELSIRRPVTILMVFLAMLVTGLVALQRVPLEMMPAGFKSPWMGFWVPYPNSTPEEIEELIARPFEEQMRTVAGIEYLESYSQNDGAWFFLQLRNGVNTDVAWNQLRDRLDRALVEVDLDIEKVRLRRMGMGESIFFMGVSTDMDLAEAHYLADELLRKPLEQIDGVAKVDFWGGDEQQLLIELDLQGLGRHGIGARELVTQLQQENFALGNGQVTEGGRRLTVRSDASWRDVEEVRNLPIRGSSLRLKDVANVHIGVPEQTWTMRIDRTQGLMLSIAKESTGNTEKICRDVDALLEKAARDPRLTGLRIRKLFSQGDFIRESISNLKESALWGGIFSALVIWFFLRRLRMTLLITAAIPFSVFITITAIYFSGWSLNIITMMGLMLSVGMVVDNAIVVMESIQSTREHGKDPRETAIEGTAEVSLAVTVATLTTVVVFLPLMLISDNAGFSFYMTRIGMPVVISLLASLLVALLFLPQVVSHARLDREVKESRLITRSNQAVVRLLDRCLKHRFDTAVILALVFALIAIPQKFVKQSGEGDGNVNNFELNVNMPVSYSFEDSDALFHRIEDQFAAQETRYNIKTITSRHSNNWGQVEVFMNSDVQRSWYAHAVFGLLEWVNLYERPFLNRAEVIEDVKKNLPTVPGVEMNIGWGDEGQDESAITVSINGQDTNVLRALAEEARRRMEGLPQIMSTELDVDEGDQELRLLTDRSALDRAGVSALAVAGTVRYALSGSRLADLRQNGREIGANVRLAEEDRDQLAELQNLTVESVGGSQVPLGELLTVEHRTAMGQIRRSQGKSFMRIKITTEAKDTDALNGSLRTILEGMVFPPGYDWSFGRFADRLAEQQNSQQLAMMLALSFVFLLMGILFESFTLPLTILASIPFAIWGAQWALFVTGSSFDMMAGIGVVILVGIVVNNAIVLIDRVVRLRRQGVERHQALLLASEQRFRPVMMTAATTICGLIPMAVGNSALIGLPYAPMGRSMMGGLLVSTLSTLIVIPLVYTLIDDLGLFTVRLAGQVLQGRKRKPAMMAGATADNSPAEPTPEPA